MFTPERIDLHLPMSWKQATTRELELIARVMMNEGQQLNSFHPFDMFSVKVALFFLLSDIKVCSPAEPSVAVEDPYYLCRRSFSVDPWYRKLWRKIRNKDNEPFVIYASQIIKEIHRNLSWLDRPSEVMIFPYAIYKSKGVTFHAPAELMQDFSWQRYRFATDYFAAYIQSANRMARIKNDPATSNLDYRKAKKMVTLYRSMFLATLFTRKIKRMDEETHLVVNDYAYVSNQSVDNAKYFRKFRDDRFQVVLFWWGGMSQYLQKTYPHCFKTTKVKKSQQNPLELYTRTTATMEKYLGMSEKEVNSQLYTVIFQHLEDMAKEAEEMDRIKNKNS